MSYEPTQWKAGDTVTSAKLNKIEQGISDNGLLEINAIIDEEAGEIRLDKTWQEIYNANNSIIIITSDSGEYPIRTKVVCVSAGGNGFIVSCFLDGLIVFSAAASDDYPIINKASDDDHHVS